MGMEARKQENAENNSLKEIHRQLEWLAGQTREFPIEYSVGEYDLFFESRDDIQLMLEHLTDEIADDRTLVD
jgi:fido (protein-threonine AMPylation protein)